MTDWMGYLSTSQGGQGHGIRDVGCIHGSENTENAFKSSMIL